MTTPFSISRDGAVAILTHDDGKANTFVQTTFEQLLSALDEIEKSDATAVVYRGRAGYFSAGLNLKVLPNLQPGEWVTLLEKFGAAAMRLFLFPKPIVAHVTGHAIGAGAIAAFACDVRFFNQGAFRFGLNEVPNGLPVPRFGVVAARSATRIGDQMELICHGRMLSPDEARERRIAEAVADDAHGAALERARALSELPSGVYASTKRTLRGDAAKGVAESIRSDAEKFIATMTGKV
jgi:enoyl-CoA hydratase